jgi:hypothetical protein
MTLETLDALSDDGGRKPKRITAAASQARADYELKAVRDLRTNAGHDPGSPKLTRLGM